ncbi:helix-turn-helix domain-containing protein [Saliphagus sp. LR7]|uniref:ArsR/SmtB family transcription factor n=1 Tax=Saliphagus sp. LR7 TaxID=2282654 RepID=UPI000DF8498B|nr:helix-turn-helix domain-containing protein [Saliphagus sp. LR7]
MARLFPLRSETPETDDRPRVVDLEGEDADAVFGALSSTTARRIYGHLAAEPATPSDVAEAVDTSIQNVRYHIESLEEAGLIEVVDTWYSSRGNEMSVYAASDGPLVVAADRSRADRLREALSRYLGGLAVLAGASLFVQYGLERLASAMGLLDSSGFGGDDAGPEDASTDGDDAGEDGGTEGDDARETEAADEEDALEEEGAGIEDVGGANESSGNDTGGVDTGGGANETGGVDDGADANATGTNETGTGGADTPTPTETSTPTETPTPTETEPVGTGTPADGVPEAADAVLGAVPPGVLFFLGGLCVLTLVTVWWYRRPY